MTIASCNFFRNGKGYKFFVDIGSNMNDDLINEIRNGQLSFVEQSLAMLPFFRDGRVVIDIGANIGCVSLPHACLGYTVHAFEAGPKNADLLRNSVSLNGFGHYFVHQKAVSNSDGFLTFADDGCHGHVIEGFFADFNDVDVQVPCIRIDDYGLEINERIAFIKMDIEGSEVAAIHGMKSFLVRHDLPPLYVEVNGYCLSAFNYSPNDLIKSLEDIGYVTFVHDRSGVLVPRTSNDIQPWHYFDYIFVAANCTENFSKLIQNYPSTREYDVDRMIGLAFTEGQNLDVQKIYTGFMLQRIPEQLRRPNVVQALDKLRRDENAQVRNSVSWWPGPF